jgi:hypothetical protein
MKLEKEFKAWLNEKYPDAEQTVRNRVSNCKNVEKYYGDLGDFFETDKCTAIINELTYSTSDERQNNPQKHKIPIDGDIRTGSATLKQAVKLYVNFMSSLNEEKTINIEQTTESESKKTEISEIKNKLVEVLTGFEFKKETYITPKKHHNKTITKELHTDILNYLESNFPIFNWEIEYKPSNLYKDSIDIFGESESNDVKIIIELDAWRADQVAKKFLSRSALFLEDNLIYVSLCYPGTKNMSQNECQKYFTYCKNLSEFISKKTDVQKLYIGHFLELV